MPPHFRKVLLSAERFESAGVFDVNNDGIPDIVSGEFWYEGPEFKKQYRICRLEPKSEYFDDFSTIPMDVNGDGHMDYITGGYWGCTLRWRENPGVPGKLWPEHIIAETGNIETTRAWDVDGDGELELVPNTPGHPLVVYKLIRDANGKGTGKFDAHKLKFAGRENDKQDHGLGFGDITGNGRGDFVLRDGWLEAPEDPWNGEWIWHPEFLFPWGASIPMLVEDVNRDGKAEIVVGGGHSYGLSYWTQELQPDGSRKWTEHPIDPYSSQFHDMHWADIDGDGEKELITGKRFRSHPHNEAGVFDPLGWYIFKWTGESFAKIIGDFGPIGTGHGLGIFSTLADLNGNGRLDLVAPGKEGLAIYFNEGNGMQEMPEVP